MKIKTTIEEKEVDASLKVGDIVKGKFTGVIVMVTDPTGNRIGDFSGVIIEPGSYNDTPGHYSTEWTKDRFEKFYGTITMSTGGEK